MTGLRTLPVRAGCAVLGLLGAVTLGGCSSAEETPPQEKEAINLGANQSVGAVQMENLLLISEGKGKPARIIGLVLNTSDEQARVTLSDDDDSTTIVLKPEQQYSFHEKATVFATADVPPGSRTKIDVDTAGQSATVSVPVRNGQLDWLKPYVPK